MMIAALDLSQQRWELVKLGLAIAQPVLIVLLFAGFVLASAHLLTMLGTRWGKRRVSSKALAFSVVLHLCLACGILAIWPEAVLRTSAASDVEEPAPERFEVVTIPEEELPEPPEEQGTTPVWEELPDTLSPELVRSKPEFEPSVESLPSRPSVAEIARAETVERTPLTVPEEAMPSPETQSLEGPSDPAAVPLEVDDPRAEARADVETPSMSRERSPAVSVNVRESEDVPRPQAGTVERLSPDPDPNRDVTSIGGFSAETAPLQRADEAAEMMRRTAPAPDTLTVDDVGVGEREVAEPGQNTAPLRPQVARERTRTPQSINETGVERYRPSDIPKQPERPSLDPVQSLAATTPAEMPSLERPDLEIPAPGDQSRVPAPYRMRTQDQREEAARKYGGTDESERAVELSLQWLAANQTAGGFWDSDAQEGGRISVGFDGVDRGAAGKNADTGVTGLAVLAFLGAGHTYEKGDYQSEVQSALRWLISQQRPDGSLSGNASNFDAAYCHAIATYAMAEAYAMRTSESAGDWLAAPVRRALGHTLELQLADGGWRYMKNQRDGDMSIFGWHLMSLKSGELGGIPIPGDVRKKMIDFLVARGRGQHGGLAAYRADERPSPPMTAEALFCKQMLGIDRTNPAAIEAVEYVQRFPPHRSQLNYYYWYYGSMAMHEHGGEPWEKWNAEMRDLVVNEQIQTGVNAGSWDPRDLWGPYGGRVYSTAVATLCLEVYYRYLPLYRLGEEFEAE
ncbi:MAG: hypothetical protein DWQ34_07365 [Planctomycetota bacterium]|nr:MAG: hypothetical protein DWQ29_16050 [Planctomycetota bacterium]REJ94921.1 MAG: hypothetical protein DWQ34_07365 [Planctomycetota bacterium]REK26514.1 MAG: hypothetical protein DWQ41_09625 [Planctomycetota bacterium]REK33967.1 MAG: hypothetical protein DWQ45_14180 [Planctomycetota bacterium]